MNLWHLQISVFRDKVFVSLSQVKERPDVGVYIKDLPGYVVYNADDMDRFMTLGNKNRKQKSQKLYLVPRLSIQLYFILIDIYTDIFNQGLLVPPT